MILRGLCSARVARSSALCASTDVIMCLMMCLVTLTCLSTAHSAPAWEQIHEEEGVTVYKRDSSLGELPDFKATGIIKASVFDVIAVIRDVDRREEWVFRCEDSKLVKSYGHFEVLLYHRTDSPWPADDRDAAVMTNLFELVPEREYLAYFKGVKHKLIPARDDAIRIPTLEGYYRFKHLKPNETQVTYFVHIDPGGYLPRWLVRMTTYEFPTDTLLGLRRQVKKTKRANVYRAFHQEWNPAVRPVGTPAPAKLSRPSEALSHRLDL